MDSNTGSELIVTIAWRSAEIAALASALMLTIALIVRRYLRSQEQLQARVIAEWRPLLTRITLEDDEIPVMPALPARRLPYLMEEWNALHDAVRGNSSVRLNEVAQILGFDVAARRMMHSRQIARRILAIRTLGHLRDETSWRNLQEPLASANALVSFYAAAALVQIDPQRAMPGIMLQLAERESWPGEAMARLLVDAGADVARGPIRELMLSLAPDKIPRLLPWLAHVDAMLTSELAIEMLRRHSSHAEVVAAALLNILDPKVLPELARFADSPNADVRKNLAQACGRLGGLGEVELLVWLLGDTVWWVRYRAGQALLNLKDMTETRLEEVRASLGDRFARDMLEQVRAEAGTA